MEKILFTLSLISNIIAEEVYDANAEENPQVFSSTLVVAGSVVCLIASAAAFWYFSIPFLEVKWKDSKILNILAVTLYRLSNSFHLSCISFHGHLLVLDPAIDPY